MRPRYATPADVAEIVRVINLAYQVGGGHFMDIDVVDLRTELPGFYAALGFTPAGSTPFADPTKTKQPVRLVRMEKPLQ